MTLKAIIFGSIGTVTETSDMQRRAFNRAFAEAGLKWDWDFETYKAMVAGDGAIVGGSDRIAAYAAARGEALSPDMIDRLHDAKSAIFQKLMADEGLSPNSGVVELIANARAKGLKLAFASTTSPENIAAMFAATAPSLTAAHFDLVLSGDDVTAIKPAPDIYLHALERLGIAADEAIAIEDTATSMAAPLAAHIPTVIVPGMIAKSQNFGETPVLQSLGTLTELEATAHCREPVS